MFGRRVTEAIRPGVVSRSEIVSETTRNGWRTAVGHAREIYRRAGRHEDALVAIDRHWCLRRTARHVVCHLVHRVRCRHFIAPSRRIGSCDGDAAMTGRETAANTRPAIIRIASSRRMAKLRFTGLNSHKTGGDEKVAGLKFMEIYLDCIDGYQIANKFDVRDGCPAQPINATQELNISLLGFQIARSYVAVR